MSPVSSRESEPCGFDPNPKAIPHLKTRKDRVRSEAKLAAAPADQTFTLSNLFEGDNTLIATAEDNDGLIGLSAPVRVKVNPSPQKEEK
jgi:hypothetical protein